MQKPDSSFKQLYTIHLNQGRPKLTPMRKGIKPTTFLQYNLVCWLHGLSCSPWGAIELGKSFSFADTCHPKGSKDWAQRVMLRRSNMMGTILECTALPSPLSIQLLLDTPAVHSGQAMLWSETRQLTQLRFPLLLPYLLPELRRAFLIWVFSFCQSLLKLISEGVTIQQMTRCCLYS